MPKFIGGHSEASFKYFLKKIQVGRRIDHELWLVDTTVDKRVVEAKLTDPSVAISRCFNLIELCRITTRHTTASPTLGEIIAQIHPNEIQRVDYFEIVRFEQVGKEWLAVVVLYRSSGRLYAPG